VHVNGWWCLSRVGKEDSGSEAAQVPPERR
jgi:hypothetical protein